MGVKINIIRVNQLSGHIIRDFLNKNYVHQKGRDMEKVVNRTASLLSSSITKMLWVFWHIISVLLGHLWKLDKMPGRKGLLAPQNNFLDTIATRFDGTRKYLL